MNVSKVLVEINEICNYVPIVSTATNIINIFLKYLVTSFLSEKTLNNHFWNYIKCQPLSRSLKAAVPGLGNIAVFLDDRSLYKKLKTLKSRSLEEIQLLLDQEPFLRHPLGQLGQLIKALPKELKLSLERELTEDQKNLVTALYLDDVARVKALLKKNVPLNFTAGGLPLLAIACQSSSIEIVKLLLERINPNTTGFQGITPLVEAIAMGRKDIVKLLLQSGAQPDQKLDNGADATYMAILIGDQADLLPFLFRKDDKVDARRYEFTPVNIEQSNGTGLLPTVKDLTPLLFACFVGAVESALYLVNRSKNMHAIDSTGSTVLHYAVSCDVKLLNAILKKSSDKSLVNQRNYDGDTPLAIAIRLQREDAALALLKAGANPFVILPNHPSNETLFDIACKNKLWTVINWIKEEYTLTLEQIAKTSDLIKIPCMPLPIISESQVRTDCAKFIRQTITDVIKEGKNALDRPRLGMEILFGRIF